MGNKRRKRLKKLKGTRRPAAPGSSLEHYPVGVSEEARRGVRVEGVMRAVVGQPESYPLRGVRLDAVALVPRVRLEASHGSEPAEQVSQLRPGRAEEVNRAYPEPPARAVMLLDLLLSPKEQESATGDLHELYGKRVARRGVRRANLWLYSQVARSTLALLWRLVTLGWIADWIRRHIS